MGRRLWRSRLDQVTGVLLGVLVLAQVVWAVVGTFCLPDHINSRQALLNSVWGIGVWTLVSVWVITRWEGVRWPWLVASGICVAGFLIQLKPPVVLVDYLPPWGSPFLPYTLLAILLSCLVIYLVPVKHDAAGTRRWRLHPWAAPGAALGLLIIPLWFLGNIFYLVAVPPGTNFTGDMAVAWETTLKAGRLEFISLEEPELLVKADDRLSSINTGTGRINWQTDLTWASREVFWQKAGDRAWVVAAVSGGWAAAISRTDGQKLWDRRDLAWMPSWGTGPDTTGPALRIVTSQYYSPAAKYLDHYLILDAQTGAPVLAQTAAGRHFASYRYDCFRGFRGPRTLGEDILVRAKGPPPAVPYILPGLASIYLRAEERNIERLGGGLADYLKLMGKWVPVMKLPIRIGSELSSVLPTPRMVIVSGQKDGQYCLYGLRYVGNGT